MSDDTTNLEVTGPGGIGAKLAGKRMAEVIAMLSVIALAILSYTVYMMYGTMQGVSGAITDLAKAQRELTCIISLPAVERERQYGSPNSFCRQLGRMP